jgi:aminoglycoside phosphotransferase (APT) family kinase protein
MILPGELERYFETLARTIAFELRPDLRSGHALKSADYLLEVIDRLRAQVRDSERIAVELSRVWTQLRGEALSPSVATRVAAPDGLRSAEAAVVLEMQALQEAFVAGGERLRVGRGDDAWFRRAALASRDYWEKIEDSVQPAVAPAAAQSSGSEDDPEALRVELGRYLGRRFPRLPDDPVAELRIAPGGNTKRTALCQLRPNAVLPLRVVLRQDRPRNLTGTRITDEFPVLERLFGLGIKVPQPLLVEADSTQLDGAFALVAEVTDAVPAGTYFAKDRARQPRRIGPAFGRDAAQELARLHRATALSGANQASWQAHQKAADAARARWRVLDRPPNSLVIDLGYAWLERHPIGRDRPRCLIHGDYGVHNMMARDGRLAAILDWELAEEGDPAIDLAECRMMMVEDTLPWEQFAAAYVEAGGDPRACERSAVDYYCVWMYTVKFGMMMAEARSAYLGGLRTDGLMASVASHSMDRILLYAARALALALEGEA